MNIENHLIYVYHELTKRTPVVNTDTEGNVIMSDDSEIIDVANTELVCLTCEGDGLDLYEVHSISKEWQCY